MKKTLLSQVTGFLLLLVPWMMVKGQLTNTGVPLPGGFTFVRKSEAKKSTDFHRESRIDPRVLRSFVSSYANVQDETWFELPDGFVAMFKLEGIDHQVRYSKKGSWIYTIRTYPEEKLSHDVRHIVKSTYYDYTINSVQEIEKPLEPVTYIIQLLGKTELINLRVCDDEVTVLQRFKKSG
jgi:hypothetical protein